MMDTAQIMKMEEAETVGFCESLIGGDGTMAHRQNPSVLLVER